MRLEPRTARVRDGSEIENLPSMNKTQGSASRTTKNVGVGKRVESYVALSTLLAGMWGTGLPPSYEGGFGALLPLRTLLSFLETIRNYINRAVWQKSPLSSSLSPPHQAYTEKEAQLC